MLRRAAPGRAPHPTAVILDARAVQSAPASGARTGDDGHTRRTGAKTHAAVDTLGHLLALTVTPAPADDRTQVGTRAARVQEVPGQAVQLAFADQGSVGPQPAAAAAAYGSRRAVVKLPKANRGCVPPPRRWVVERALAWAARFRRLARAYERLPATAAGLHLLAFVCLLLHRLVLLLNGRA
jgi:transposase